MNNCRIVLQCCIEVSIEEYVCRVNVGQIRAAMKCNFFYFFTKMLNMVAGELYGCLQNITHFASTSDQYKRVVLDITKGDVSVQTGYPHHILLYKTFHIKNSFVYIQAISDQ